MIFFHLFSQSIFCPFFGIPPPHFIEFFLSLPSKGWGTRPYDLFVLYLRVIQIKKASKLLFVMAEKKQLVKKPTTQPKSHKSIID